MCSVLCLFVSRTQSARSDKHAMPATSQRLPCCRAVYFVQGILGLARLALTYFFKDELHLDPVRHAEMQMV